MFIRLCKLITNIFICFICWQLLFFIIIHYNSLKEILFANNIVATPKIVIFSLIFFIIKQFLCYLFIILFVAYIAYYLPIKKKYALSIICSIMVIILIISVNQIFCPNSIFSLLSSILFKNQLAKYYYYFASIILICFFLCALLKNLLQLSIRKSLSIISIFGIIVIFFIIKYHHKQQYYQHINKAANVFIIGIDDIRPDYFYNNKYPQYLNDFLTTATKFQQNFTPLARTYPSWVSILTGLSPLDSGARFNLQIIKDTDKQQSLAKILKKQNYITIFAIDDHNFSTPINKSFGFDKIIAPNSAVTTMLLPLFADFPLTNIINNTFVAKYLWPDVYINRMSLINYKPQNFSKVLQQKLLKSPESRPIFLAVHFCLSHWPFYWQNMPNNNNSLDLYVKSVKRVKLQVSNFLRFLQQYGFLQHAVVILLSDHGNAFGQKDRNLYKYIARQNTLKSTTNVITQTNDHLKNLAHSFGHGTDVLSIDQYQTILAINLYNMQFVNQAVSIQNLTSLMDIKNTILQLLKLKTTTNYSLIPYLKKTINLKSRNYIIVESGFSPQAILNTRPSALKLMHDGAHMFYINKKHNNMLLLRHQEIPFLLKHKQYAIYTKNKILALYPLHAKKLYNKLAKKLILNKYLVISVDRKTGDWTDEIPTDIFLSNNLNKLLNYVNGE